MTSALTNRACIALIDIGNTRLKIGWLNPVTGQREPAALALDPHDAQALVEWFREQKVQPVRALGVNVAGAGKAMLTEQLFKRHFGVTINWQTSQALSCDVLNQYRDPTQLGADRWAAMIGLSALQSASDTPLLLANFGTATTLDTLCPGPVALGTDARHKAESVDWVYAGGLILPGPELMRASLARNTAQLPQADGSAAPFPDRKSTR